MAIAFRSQNSGSGVSDVIVNYPSGWAAGDLLLCLVESSNEAITAPSGFTELASSPQGTGAVSNVTTTRLSAYYRIATALDGTQIQINDPGNHALVLLMAYSGVNTTTPLDVTPVGGQDTDLGGTSTATGVTTTTANCMIIVAYADSNDSLTGRYSGWANANLTGFAERTEVRTTEGNGGGIGVADGVKATAGATGSSTVNYGAATNLSWMTLALRPASTPTIGDSVGVLMC